MPHNFKLVNADTDSIMVNKSDGSEFTDEEKQNLIVNLNEQYPDGIRWEDDGEYKAVIVLRAKNYVLDDGKKVKYKGSGVKATTKEPALKQFIKDIIQEILDEQFNYEEVYHRYVKEIMSIQDITRWCSKKTVTDKVLNPKRTNELKVFNAIQETDYKESDKIYVFFREDDSLCLKENFDGDYNKKKLLKKLFDTSKLFDKVLPVKELFPNYSLKKNQEALEQYK